jgi:hypothetical protein
VQCRGEVVVVVVVDPAARNTIDCKNLARRIHRSSCKETGQFCTISAPSPTEEGATTTAPLAIAAAKESLEQLKSALKKL